MLPHRELSSAAGHMDSSELVHREFVLRDLLEQYERSKAFGISGVWRRDCILKIDKKTLPDYFAADGRERLAALRSAVLSLQAEGAVRVVHAESFGEQRIHEVRLGPTELEAAYRAATAFSFMPLAVALGHLDSHVRALLAGASAPWMVTFLQAVLDGIPAGDLRPLGMQRERFKQNWRDVRDSLTAAVALSMGVDEWERMLSERLFRNSKRLAEIRSFVSELLTRADPKWLELNDEDVLPAYGLRRKPGFIVCAGSATLSFQNRTYELADFSPVAHIPEGWSVPLVSGVAKTPIHTITTIENEFPFLAYVEEAGGPEGLFSRGELAVFTSGFPTPRLVTVLSGVCRSRPDLQWQHWGDADLGGLRIWWFLRTRLGRQLHLLRTTAEWLFAAALKGGTPLSEAEQCGLTRLRRQLYADDATPDILQATMLIDALLHLQIKVEQERF